MTLLVAVPPLHRVIEKDGWSYVVGPDVPDPGPWRYRWEAQKYADELNATLIPNQFTNSEGNMAGKKNGDDTTGVEAIRGNGFDPDMVQSFVSRILNLHGDLDTERSNYMNACKPIHADIALVVDEAKDKGIPKKALKGAVKKRLLERKIENIREDFEGEDLDNYDLVLQALGDLSDTPLGGAALQRTTRRTPEATTAD